MICIFLRFHSTLTIWHLSEGDIWCVLGKGGGSREAYVAATHSRFLRAWGHLPEQPSTHHLPVNTKHNREPRTQDQPIYFLALYEL